MNEIENMDKLFAQLNLNNNIKSDKLYNQSLKKLLSKLKKYSVDDLLVSMFISSIWPGNISSPIRHQLIIELIASADVTKFSKIQKIEKYSDFKRLMTTVCDLIPDFPMYEDYVPELDWGQIKTSVNGSYFKILYGSEIEYLYDHLNATKLLYSSICCNGEEDNCLIEEDLKQVLTYVDCLTRNIEMDKWIDPDFEIKSGTINVPPQQFWKQICEEITNFQFHNKLSMEFLTKYTAPIGTWERSQIKQFDSVPDRLFSGQLYPFLFIQSNGDLFPILPRRAIPIILQNIYKEIDSSLDQSQKLNSVKLELSKRFNKYISDRIQGQLFENVYILKSDGTNHDLLFNSAIVIGDTLLLIHLLNPLSKSHDISPVLKSIAKSFEEVGDYVSQNHSISLRFHRANSNTTAVQLEEKRFTIELLVIFPKVGLDSYQFELPELLENRVIELDQFMAIVDEIEEDEDLIEFLYYWDNNSQKFMSGGLPIDTFASFVDSSGTLIEGANTVDHILLVPHWGSNFRFNSLKDFWTKFPNIYYDDARSYIVEGSLETRALIGLKNKKVAPTFYVEIGSTKIEIDNSYSKLTHNDLRIYYFFIDSCLVYNFIRFKDLLGLHPYFTNDSKISIKVYGTLGTRDIVDNCPWVVQSKKVSHKKYLVNIFVNIECVKVAFHLSEDSKLECKLISDIVSSIVPDSFSLLANIDKCKTETAHSRLISQEKEVDFPDQFTTCVPSPKDYKASRKIVSELALKCNIEPGLYSGETAKSIINDIRLSIATKIDSEVAKLDWNSKAISLVITCIDSISARYERDEFQMIATSNFKADYSPITAFSEKNEEFFGLHKNYRYLIEKFVQFNPTGANQFSKKICKSLLSLIDLLYLFQSSSDIIHYGLEEVELVLSNEFIPTIMYSSDYKQKHDAFKLEKAKFTLSDVEDVSAEFIMDDDFLNNLDDAFLCDLNFEFTTLLQVLQIFSQWPSFYSKDSSVKSVYCLPREEVIDFVVSSIKQTNSTQIDAIIDFLLLKKEGMLEIIGSQNNSIDLPIWEHRKRHYRYYLKPLVQKENLLFWGAHSTNTTSKIWRNNLLHGVSPIELESKSIKQCLDNAKHELEKSIVNKAFDIVSVYSEYIEKECQLHKRQKNAGHPSYLGDYDIICFIEPKNTIILIECKHYSRPYCIKDITRYLNKIFENKKSDIFKIQRRHEYIRKHYTQIFVGLNWPVVMKDVKVLSFHLSDFLLPETQFAEVGFNLCFTTLNRLDTDLQSFVFGK